MSKFVEKKVMLRYRIVMVLLSILLVAVVLQAARLMTTRKWYWDRVASSHQNKTAVMPAKRGDIFSADGQLLASTIPEYEVYMDFRPGDGTNKKWDDSLAGMWRDSMSYICEGLHHIFPQKTAEQFEEQLSKGYEQGKRHLRIMPGRVDHTSFSDMKNLPILRYPSNLGGFHYEAQKARRHPFGSLAERTIGSRDSSRYGIELAFDSLLRGKEGFKHREKVRMSKVDVVDQAPVDGYDIVSTIDIGMQSIVEEALLAQLQHYNAELGVAIVMEVKTGDVKAITNMSRSGDGMYRERLNDALGYRCEPGSVFKTASILVALDDGVVDTSYVVDTEGGRVNMHGSYMTDHNYRTRGGYGRINVARSLEVSSNIGVSRVIDRFYGAQPEKYVEGLYRVGIGEDLQLPLNEYRKPNIRFPTDANRYWSSTTLPWMSIGYETQIAPINTLTFYNAIANNGRMMRPRFATHVMKDGEVVMPLPPQVIKEQIAKPQSIATIQKVLEHVVSQGLGARAGSPAFKVAGKTGTAQVADGKHKYSDPVKCYWLSFCGYFPADNPRYSCIVCIKNLGGPASGGLLSGTVFRQIAEGIMAKDVRKVAERARDGRSILVPEVKNGNLQAASFVLGQLGINQNGFSNDGDLPAWGQTHTDSSNVTLRSIATPEGVMPDLSGMGARDAVFLLESLGLNVRLQGNGCVSSQSIAAGTPLRRGMTCQIQLDS